MERYLLNHRDLGILLLWNKPNGFIDTKIIRHLSRTQGSQVPQNITVISAGAANQIASWEKDEKHSLFTKYFLKGMSGEGDKAPYGNGGGKVT